MTNVDKIYYPSNKKSEKCLDEVFNIFFKTFFLFMIMGLNFLTSTSAKKIYQFFSALR